MTVEHVRTASVGTRTLTRPAPAPPQPSRRPDGSPLCLLVPELNEGDGIALVRTLRRRESTRAVLLTRKAGRRELVVLLGGGVRGAVTAETPGAVRIAGRPVLPAPAPAPAPAAPAPSLRPGPDLTARELGVLRLVADGQSNREIGERLDLSALTVKSHLARISRKVGTGDRAEMVAFAIRNKLLA